MRTVVIAAAVAAVLGAAAGIVVAAAGGSLHRAQTTIAVEVSGVPVAGSARARGALVVPTIAHLATGTLVVENVASSLHLSPGTVRARLHARAVGGTALIRLSYDDPSAVRALADVQQAAVVLTSIVASQFGSGRQRLAVAVVDPPRPGSSPRKPYGRDGGVGALLGALAGAVLAAGMGRQRRPRAQRAVAAQPPAEPASAPVVEREAPAEPEPEPEPEPKPEPVLPPSAPGELTQGAWSLAELERRVRAADAGDARRDEWLAYLDALRPAAQNGTLGPAYDSVVFEVFGDLL